LQPAAAGSSAASHVSANVSLIEIKKDFSSPLTSLPANLLFCVACAEESQFQGAFFTVS